MAVKLPEQFINQMQSLLGEKADLFFASLDKIVPISIRQNPYKYTEIQHLIPVSSVNWEPFGSYLQKRPRFANDPLFHAGSYYVTSNRSLCGTGWKINTHTIFFTGGYNFAFQRINKFSTWSSQTEFIALGAIKCTHYINGSSGDGCHRNTS